ncbi:MAG TPA: hypothetical protein VJ901_09895 [Thermoanaerobaculia bacterium]|nr:hypothetical protein [Thermoanaerobaculia bacterium]
MKSSKFFTSFLIVLALTLSAPFANAAESATHNPYTVLGVQLRAALIANSADGASPVNVGPAVFQEIVPCRLISTLEVDHYSPQWGTPSLAPNESRSYRSTGMLVDGTWTNPCSQRIPENALAVAARVWAVGPATNTAAVLWVTPGDGVAPDDMSKIVLRESEQSAAEATFVLHNHMFTMTSQNAGADFLVDVIGYFLPDPWGRGDKGERGADGAQGLKGDKGDAGAQGIQGEKGERGADGAQGLKGDKGDAGTQGIQGDKGERGADGAQGLKGDKGDAGAQGIQGEKGERGTDGAQGSKGDQGSMGPIGPQGPQGPKGDSGGPYVSSMNCIAQGQNSITLTNSAVHANSAILVTVTGRSLGNTISVLDQGEGWVTISGKPATCFRYIVFN